MVGITERLSTTAARLSDDELLCELECSERCALLSTRTRREIALLRLRCVRRELERRKGLVTPTVGVSSGHAR
jgi:hypothetical protein